MVEESRVPHACANELSLLTYCRVQRLGADYNQIGGMSLWMN